MKLGELKTLAGLKGSSVGRPRLVGVYRKEHDRVYVWQLSDGGYSYEIEFANTNEKIASDKPFKDIDTELRGKGYKSIIENKEDIDSGPDNSDVAPPTWPPHAPF